jgi:hypothetical protein
MFNPYGINFTKLSTNPHTQGIDEKLKMVKLAKKFNIPEGKFYISDLLNSLLSKKIVKGWST